MRRRKRLNLLNIIYYYVQRCTASSNNNNFKALVVKELFSSEPSRFILLRKLSTSFSQVSSFWKNKEK